MPLPTSDQPLRLAPHVRACASDGQIILLDLRKGSYLGIGDAKTDVLADRVEGWPRSPDSGRECTTTVATKQLVASLLERGLLTHEGSKQSPPVTVEEVTSSLNAEDESPNLEMSARHLVQFFKCAAQTTLWMRYRSLHAIAKQVESRRDRLHSPSASCSLESVRTGTAVYERLRPFAFSAHKNCLFDSLALVAFLASERAFPRWVIGVKTRPFAAHSWVQMGATVLNDQHEMVRQFRPILVV